MRKIVIWAMIAGPFGPMTSLHPDKPKQAYDPTEHHKLRNKAPRVLGDQQFRIPRVVPAEALAKLRKIAIWVERNERPHPCMCYHADADSAAEAPSPLPALSDDEKAAGWKLLFDGVRTTGWRGLGMDGFPTCWIVHDRCLKCLGGYKGANDLVTVEEYENFELSFEWLFPKTKGNSGVKYRVQEQKGKGYAFGCEYQCLNDPKAADRHASGALYDVLEPRGAKLADRGTFNRSRIVVNGTHLEHWLNGVKVVEGEFGSAAMQAALARSHFKNSDWGKKPRGRIALQNHHSEVLFRNLKIRVPPAEAK